VALLFWPNTPAELVAVVIPVTALPVVLVPVTSPGDGVGVGDRTGAPPEVLVPAGSLAIMFSPEYVGLDERRGHAKSRGTALVKCSHYSFV